MEDRRSKGGPPHKSGFRIRRSEHGIQAAPGGQAGGLRGVASSGLCPLLIARGNKMGNPSALLPAPCKFLRVRNILPLAALALACLFAYRVGRGSFFSGEANEGLTVGPRHLDLGQVWEEEGFQWTVPIENHGSEDAEIVGFCSSCSQLSEDRPHLPPCSSRASGTGSSHAELDLPPRDKYSAGQLGLHTRDYPKTEDRQGPPTKMGASRDNSQSDHADAVLGGLRRNVGPGRIGCAERCSGHGAKAIRATYRTMQPAVRRSEGR